MDLHEIFEFVAYKRLVAVDIPDIGSHQHELNGVSQLKGFFSTTESVSGVIEWHYFGDNEDPVHSSGRYTFYDARAKGFARTGRSEWRLYYSGEFLGKAEPGDILLLVRKRDTSVHGLILEANSAWQRSAMQLFSFAAAQDEFYLIPESVLEGAELEFSRRGILEELDIGVEVPSSSSDEELAAGILEDERRDGREYPTTLQMAELTRSNTEVDLRDADGALVAWLEREEQIFKAVEKIVVQEKLDIGFSSVDEFISYSKSVINRRKSRMGYALQNHIAFLLRHYGLRFDTQVTTEGKAKPDFLFPGRREYLDATYSEDLLRMLAAKSSCKDRWRQILVEAARIGVKHLCTLEQAISEDQTDEMLAHNVALVVPVSLQPTYTARQREALLGIGEFIEETLAIQSRH